MSPVPFPRQFGLRVARVVRPVCIASLVLVAHSCDKKSGTPRWNPSEDQTAASGISSPSDRTSVSAPTVLTRRNPSQPVAKAAPGSAAPGLRFIAYNVQNWLIMDRFIDQKPLKSAPKPDSEKSAVVTILTQHSPDIIGLCEIGEAKDLLEIQLALKAAGLDLPYSQHTGGSDPVRHLGLLSRFPLTSPATPALTEFQMQGQSLAINRGILDVSLAAHGKSYRLLGVHLKSKRETEGADQAEMRVHEARLLRRHVESILLTDPQARLIVYGDFNDTRPSMAFKTVIGNYNDPTYLTAIPFKDSRAEAWTHYWALHDIYTRLDFVMVSRALKAEVNFKTSRILEDPEWIDASDHRPLLTLFK